jgi:FkbM family methyltransferase
MSAEMWVNPRYLKNEVKISKEVLKSCNHKKITVVDVGANIGVFSLMMAKLMPESEIHAFEPHPKIFKFLAKNIELNGASIFIHNVALGSKSAKVFISNKHADDMNQIITVPTRSRTETSMTTLDALFRDNDISLLKIDVEGMEKEILLGALNTLERVQNLIIEVDAENYRQFGTTIEEVIEILKNLDFILVGIYQRNRNLQLTYPLKLSGARGENILATKMTEEEINNLLSAFNN